jgi:hypothetical protein
MTVLELKGDMMEKISVLKDKNAVENLHRLVNAFISQQLDEPDFWDELTPAQRGHLMKAVEAAKDKSKWIPHEEAFKKYEKWLS